MPPQNPIQPQPEQPPTTPPLPAAPQVSQPSANIVSPSPPPKNKSKIALIIIALVLVIGGAAVWYFTVNSSKKPSNNAAVPGTSQTSEATDTTASTATTKAKKNVVSGGTTSTTGTNIQTGCFSYTVAAGTRTSLIGVCSSASNYYDADAGGSYSLEVDPYTSVGNKTKLDAATQTEFKDSVLNSEEAKKYKFELISEGQTMFGGLPAYQVTTKDDLGTARKSLLVETGNRYSLDGKLTPLFTVLSESTASSTQALLDNSIASFKWLD